MTTDNHTQIKQLFQAIGETFSNLDFDAWLSHFTTPRTIISKGNVFSSASTEETRNMMMPVFQSLRQRGDIRGGQIFVQVDAGDECTDAAAAGFHCNRVHADSPSCGNLSRYLD